MKILAGLLGGVILAILGSILATVALAAVSPEVGGISGAIGFFAFWIVGVIIALMAPTAPKAWRRDLPAFFGPFHPWRMASAGCCCDNFRLNSAGVS